MTNEELGKPVLSTRALYSASGSLGIWLGLAAYAGITQMDWPSGRAFLIAAAIHLLAMLALAGRRSLATVPWSIVFGTIVAGCCLLYMQREASAREYADLASNLGQGSPSTRMAIALSMKDGKLTRFEFIPLIRKLGDESVMTFQPGASAPPLAEARASLLDALQQPPAPAKL